MMMIQSQRSLFQVLQPQPQLLLLAQVVVREVLLQQAIRCTSFLFVYYADTKKG